jgi:hypothetical protein
MSQSKSNDLPHDTLESALVPLDCLLLGDAMTGTNLGLAATTLGDTLARSGPVFSLVQIPVPQLTSIEYSHAAVEVHSVDTNRRVVLDAEIDVFADAEAEVACLGEVALPQLVFLDLEATLQNFLCFWSPNCDVNSNLLVTTDTEGSDSVAGLA